MSDVGVFVSDDYEKDFFESNIEEETRENGESTEKKLKIIKVIFWILCLAIFGEFIAYKFVLPCFSSPKVTVSGEKYYTAQEIAEKLLVMDNINWLRFDVDQAMAILSSDAAIENVSVEKVFPDKINIRVKERDAVAVTFIVENGHTYPVAIDKTGVLYKEVGGKTNFELPIISGLPVEYMAGGMRIPSTYRPLIDQINKIEKLSQNYFAGISEICVVSKDSGNYELEIIPSNSKVKVLTDRKLNEEALTNMMIVLDVLDTINADVSELDLRYGSVSIK